LIVAIADATPHDRYFFQRPMEMIAGDVTPPGCFLDAPEMLARQFTAYCLDRWFAISGAPVPGSVGKVLELWQGGGFFRKGLEAWFTFWIEAVWGKRRIMEVYLNVAETGIGTYGAEAGAQRYFGKSAARLSADEASRMAAALPSPKKRAVKGPGGWLARHGNRIERRIGIVKRDGLDACVYN
jgi:hypothetical protein